MESLFYRASLPKDTRSTYFFFVAALFSICLLWSTNLKCSIECDKYAFNISYNWTSVILLTFGLTAKSTTQYYRHNLKY